MRFSKVGRWVAVVLALTLVLSIPAGATASAVKPAAEWAPWASLRAIAENRYPLLAGTEKEWTSPDIAGKYAVYQKRSVDANGPLPGTTPGDWNIYVKNLNTGSEVAVTEAAGDQQYPRISGDWIVYTDESGASDEVKAFKISSRTPKNITGRAGDQSAPDISGSRIVYEDGGDVWMYNLATSADYKFQNTASEPAISGARVVYKQAGAIKINNLVDESIITLAADGGAELMPRIDGDYVVYMDEVGALDFDIVKHTISTGNSRTIASGAGVPPTYAFPDVSGTIAVWEAIEAGEPYLRAYDFVKDEVVTLANLSPTHLTMPSISGNRVVCVSSATSFFAANGDIQLGTIKAPTATLSAPSVVKYGAKPVLSGRLSENGDSLGGKSLDVLKSTNGGFTWTKVGTTTTNEAGSYGYTLPASTTSASYRARFNGEKDGFGMTTWLSRFSALSNAKTVNVRVSLSKPTGKSSISNTKRYAYYGYLKPKYPTDDEFVWIQIYKKSGGKYRYKGKYETDLSDYSTYTKYSVRPKLKLKTEGKYRIRALFPGTATNAKTYSSWKYITVY